MEQKHIEELSVQAVAAGAFIWAKFQALYPELKDKPVPKMVINKHFTATGGRACGSLHTVELSAEIFFYNQEEYYREIIPHELAHLVDFCLTGNMGHGPTWKAIMQAYGLNGDRLHSLANPLQIKRDIARGKIVQEKPTKTHTQTSFSVNMPVEFVHKDRQHNVTVHRGAVTKVNLKTIKMWSKVSNSEWTVPIECYSLRII